MVVHPSVTFLREERLPHILCEGCGIGTIVNALLEAISELEVDREKLVFVSGIGCSSRVPGYLKFDSLHTTHGRALAFATGLKLANPELEVIVITGDGDMASIGGNHFLHAARRNIDILTICVNNHTYGMTGGQASPTTPRKWKSTTTPYGAIEPPMDISKVAEAAGANYVARWSTASPLQIKEAINKAFNKEGFRLVEVLSQCPTAFGRRNKLRTAIDMLKWYKDHTISIEKAEKLEEKGEDLSAFVVVGELVDRNEPGLCRLYGLTEKKKEEEKKIEKSLKKRDGVRIDKEKILRLLEKLSSPRVRALMEEGEIEKAEKLLKGEDEK